MRDYQNSIRRMQQIQYELDTAKIPNPPPPPPPPPPSTTDIVETPVSKSIVEEVIVKQQTTGSNFVVTKNK